jgi:1-deoxy-D-xylulose-5-phosphate synthase
MILNTIKSASDLKKLTTDELLELAEQIRNEVISTVSKTGGHLASNLGVVELTIALHFLYDCPNDQIVWDVAHQSYIHKLLTGRRDRFENEANLMRMHSVPVMLQHQYRPPLVWPGPATCWARKGM